MATPQLSIRKTQRPYSHLIHQIHLWLGLVSALLLSLAGITGTVLAFREPIDFYLNRKLMAVTPGPTKLSMNEIVQKVSARYPGLVPTQLNLPPGEGRALDLMLSDGKRRVTTLAVNPYTGVVMGDWAGGNRFTDRLLHLHKALLLGGDDAAGTVGCYAAVILCVSGFLLWRKRKKVTFKLRSTPLVFALDLHSSLGICAVAFLFVFAVTGLYPTGVGVNPLPRFPEPQHAPTAELLPPEQLLAAAQQAVPDAKPVWVDLKWQAVHGGTVVTFRYPYDSTRRGRTFVYLDPWSGKVLHVIDTQRMSGYARFVLIYDLAIHAGTIGGWTTRLIAAFSGLAIPILGFTGARVWWLRRKSQRALAV